MGNEGEWHSIGNLGELQRIMGNFPGIIGKYGKLQRIMGNLEALQRIIGNLK